jgi:hypothetical protein
VSATVPNTKVCGPPPKQKAIYATGEKKDIYFFLKKNNLNLRRFIERSSIKAICEPFRNK